jgi:osmoprotectant transport system permease protein
MENGLTRRKPAWVAGGAAGIALITVAALVPGLAQPRAAYVIGTKPFTEQYVLAALIGERLRESGLSAATREGLGSAVIFNAVRASEIDVYVDYSGTIWTNQMHRTEVRPRTEVVSEMKDWLKRDGIVLVGGLGFENAYALAMRSQRAKQLGIRTLADLARHAGALSIAGDYEFFGRPEWQSIRQAYGFAFREQRTMQPEFMYAAIANGDADVIAGYTSDGRIAQHNLTVLDDPKHVIPPYDAILLVSPKRANDQALLAALAPLVDAISVAAMREANLRASGGGASVADAARWLSEILRKQTR